jgi:hypothetical protein
MRTTQYIGLNKRALEYVSDAVDFYFYKMTQGIGEEPISGRVYVMPVPPGPNKKLLAKEVIQETVWESGPMIFTHLRLILEKECGQIVDMGYFYSWSRYVGFDGVKYDEESGQVCF